MSQLFFIEYHHISNFDTNELTNFSDTWCEKITDENRKKESLLARYLLNKLCLNQFQKSIFDCGFRKDEVGKPYFENIPDWNISITHSHGYVWAAISSSPIGIDFEKVDFEKSEELKIAFDQNDWEFVCDSPKLIYQYFSLKECYSKILGTGFTHEPSKIKISLLQDKNFVKFFENNDNVFIFTLIILQFDTTNFLYENLFALDL